MLSGVFECCVEFGETESTSVFEANSWPTAKQHMHEVC